MDNPKHTAEADQIDLAQDGFNETNSSVSNETTPHIVNNFSPILSSLDNNSISAIFEKLDCLINVMEDLLHCNRQSQQLLSQMMLNEQQPRNERRSQQYHQK